MKMNSMSSKTILQQMKEKLGHCQKRKEKKT